MKLRILVFISTQVQLRNPVQFGQNRALVGPYNALGEWMCIDSIYTQIV